ncbi:MAG: type IV pilus modification PilV family protein [Plesiomonas sp.]|uniref:type IV pilus modification PilV family protein n=1 Tax=Plesiomonas sp. TaxID=2486279 RepID=UPI003EE7C0C5
MIFKLRQGFGLIEVLIAMLVMSVLTATLISYQISQARAHELSSLSMQAARLVNSSLDNIAADMKNSAVFIDCPADETITLNGSAFTLSCVNNDVSTISTIKRYTVTAVYASRSDSNINLSFSRLLRIKQGSGISE